jgi:hypothetical protein
METKTKSNPNEVIYRMIQCLNDDKLNLVYEIAEEHAQTIALSNRYSYNIKAIIKKRPKKFLPIQSLPTNVQKLFDYNEHLPDENVFIPTYVGEIIDDLSAENVYGFSLNLLKDSSFTFHAPRYEGKRSLSYWYSPLMKNPNATFPFSFAYFPLTIGDNVS